MTPAVFDQHHSREPTVISASSDDGSYVLGMGVAPNFVQEIKEEHDLKTPPTTPGMMADFGTNGSSEMLLVPGLISLPISHF